MDFPQKEILQYRMYMDRIFEVSSRMLERISSRDLNSFIIESDNRTRLINILNGIQDNIFKQFTQIKDQSTKNNVFSIIEKWKQEIHIWTEKINNFDQQIITGLQKEKEMTQKEISTIFKNKQKFKGYNLRNLR